MVSNTTELVVKAADTMLNMIGDDPSVYNVILKNKGLNSMFKTIKKYQYSIFDILTYDMLVHARTIRAGQMIFLNNERK